MSGSRALTNPGGGGTADRFLAWSLANHRRGVVRDVGRSRPSAGIRVIRPSFKVVQSRGGSLAGAFVTRCRGPSVGGGLGGAWNPRERGFLTSSARLARRQGMEAGVTGSRVGRRFSGLTRAHSGVEINAPIPQEIPRVVEPGGELPIVELFLDQPVFHRAVFALELGEFLFQLAILEFHAAQACLELADGGPAGEKRTPPAGASGQDQAKGDHDESPREPARYRGRPSGRLAYPAGEIRELSRDSRSHIPALLDRGSCARPWTLPSIVVNSTNERW